MVKSILRLALAALTLTFGESLAGPPIKDASLTGSTTVTLLNGLTITPTSSATLSITNGKTLSIGSSLSFTGTDGTSFVFPSTGGTVLTSSAAAGISGIFTFGSPSNVGKLRIAGASSGNTILDASAAAAGTLTLPAATDTLVARNTTDTLTNKTISGSSNTLSNINLASQVTGTLPVGSGGTGATTVPNARTNLGLLSVYKATDLNRDSSGFNSTTSAADPDLKFTLGSGKKYYFRFFVPVVAASSTPDINIGISGTAGATLVRWTMRAWLNNVVVGGNGTVTGYVPNVTYPLDTNPTTFEIEGTLVTSSSGDFGVWWSPAALTTDDLIVRAGASGIAWELP